MIGTIDDFYLHAARAAQYLNSFSQKHSLISFACADHIGYKCGSREEFESIRSLFELHSDYLFQSVISSRRIAYMKLKRGVETELGFLMFFELSDQKPDNSQRQRFDHVEIYPISVSYDVLLQKLEDGGAVITKEERPHHTTHDIEVAPDFVIRLMHEPLVEKIKTTEMI